MGLETASFISDLVATNPAHGDDPTQGDDHLRLIKSAVKNSFPNIAAAMNASATELNYCVGLTGTAQTQINTKLASTTFTASNILTKILTVDGAGSTLDADLLDGHTSSYFLPASSYTASDILSKLLGVDGSGSALDADLLDGNQASAFLQAVTNDKVTWAFGDITLSSTVTAGNTFTVPAGLYWIYLRDATVDDTLSYAVQFYGSTQWLPVTAVAITTPMVVFSDGSNVRVVNKEGIKSGKFHYRRLA